VAGFNVPRKATLPLPVTISNATDVPVMKLPEGNVPEFIVPEVKQDVLKVTVPLIAKLPALELALS
jgi:hypothetical protein